MIPGRFIRGGAARRFSISKAAARLRRAWAGGRRGRPGSAEAIPVSPPGLRVQGRAAGEVDETRLNEAQAGPWRSGQADPAAAASGA